MEETEEGREGLKKEEQRQDRHFEKAVMRSVDDDPELRHAEEEHKRKLAEIENDDNPRGCEGEREAKKRQIKSWTTRVVTREARRENQDSMMVSSLREEKLKKERRP